jgi:hypothetical protein
LIVAAEVRLAARRAERSHVLGHEGEQALMLRGVAQLAGIALTRLGLLDGTAGPYCQL